MEYDFYILHVFILRATFHHSDQMSLKSERVTRGFVLKLVDLTWNDPNAILKCVNSNTVHRFLYEHGVVCANS